MNWYECLNRNETVSNKQNYKSKSEKGGNLWWPAFDPESGN